MGSYNYGIAPMKYTTIQQSGYPQQTNYATQQSGSTNYAQAPRHHHSRDFDGHRFPHSHRQDQSQGQGQNRTQNRFGFEGFSRQQAGWGGGGQGGFGGWQRLTSAQHADRMFGQFDTNADGQITREELVAALDAMRGVAASALTSSTDATTTSTAATDETSVDVVAPTTETSVDSSGDTSSEAALAALLASVDTSTVDVPVAPTVADDTTGTSII